MRGGAPDPTEVRDAVRDFLRTEVLRRPGMPLADDASLFRSGLIDSFSLVSVILFLEDRYGVELPDAEVEPDRVDTIARLAELVLSRYERE